MTAGGPLAGVTVVEIGGIGPTPFAGMILADLGADVIRVDRPGGAPPFPIPAEKDLFNRGKRSVALDLKKPAAVDALLTLIDGADVAVEGYRPGVAERLGFGPDVCLRRRRSLVYGRMTGWGQDGPLAQTAGHDINYVSLTGALHAIGPAEGPPQIPLNLVGDFAGGSAYLVMGVLAALLEVERGGTGQVVDAAIVDGVGHLLAGVHTLLNSGLWTDRRGVNLIDGGAPYYGLYETADGGHMSVGSIEPAFWGAMLGLLGLSDDEVPDRSDPSQWEAVRKVLAQRFERKTMAEWTAIFDGSDACVTPVLSLEEAVDHPHFTARGTFRRDRDGAVSAAPAPRFSGSRPSGAHSSPPVGADTRDVCAARGIDVDALIADGAAVQA